MFVLSSSDRKLYEFTTYLGPLKKIAAQISYQGRLPKTAQICAACTANWSVSPICLPWDSTLPGFDLSKVSNATVTGWGRITNNVSEANDAFRQSRVSTE